MRLYGGGAPAYSSTTYRNKSPQNTMVDVIMTWIERELNRAQEDA